MANLNVLREDLNFVSGAVHRSQGRSVPTILALWAVLVPIGFALADFAPSWCGPYWLFVGVPGGIASGLIGRAASIRYGQRDSKLSRRHGKHWLVMWAAYLLFGASVATGHIDPQSSVPIWLLLSAIAYTMAGIHLDHSDAFLPSGIIMFIGYAGLVWLPLPYLWTTTGVIVSISLIVAAVRSSRACRAERPN